MKKCELKKFYIVEFIKYTNENTYNHQREFVSGKDKLEAIDNINKRFKDDYKEKCVVKKIYEADFPKII